MRVLLAEDEARVADAVARGLRREGVAVDVAPDGETALYKARVNPYDVVVLDRDLPRMHGDDVCRVAQPRAARHEGPHAHRGARPRRRGRRAWPSAPTTTCPSRSASPSSSRACRRWPGATGVARATVLQRGDVELDPARRTATRDGRDLELGPKEFGVLEALLAADGAVVSPEELLQRVWDEHADPFTNAVRMVVMTLRRKLGDPPVIHTVQGSGYRV